MSSCTASAACTAAGYSTDTFGNESTLAERWNGTSWTIQPTPSPSGRDSPVRGVVHIGDGLHRRRHYQNAVGLEVTLAERWNGTQLDDPAHPQPERRNAQHADGRVVHVDDAGMHRRRILHQQRRHLRDARGALERHELDDPADPQPDRGDVQRAQRGVVPVGVEPAPPSGTTPTAPAPGVTLAERWNGTSWAIQPTPNPTGAKSSGLMACRARRRPPAPPSGTTSTAPAPMRRWRSTGTAPAGRSSRPPTRPARRIQVGGVSCTSATACTAAGNYRNNAGIDKTLAERSS